MHKVQENWCNWSQDIRRYMSNSYVPRQHQTDDKTLDMIDEAKDVTAARGIVETSCPFAMTIFAACRIFPLGALSEMFWF